MKSPFLDLGDGTGLLKKKVVFILNAESATLQFHTRHFIRGCNNRGEAVLPAKPLRQVNSIILANSYGKDSLYTSSRSAKALAGE